MLIVNDSIYPYRAFIPHLSGTLNLNFLFISFSLSFAKLPIIGTGARKLSKEKFPV
jgi:hypothetical protein